MMKILYKVKPPIKEQIKEYFKQLDIPKHSGETYSGKRGTYGLSNTVLAHGTWDNCIKLTESFDEIKKFIDKQEDEN